MSLRERSEKPKIMDVLKTKPITNYIGIWVMFYINITCGLALISQEKMIVKCIGLAAWQVSSPRSPLSSMQADVSASPHGQIP